MNILKEIFANEVFPSIGCTEPIACAYAAAAAVEQLGAPVEKIELVVDPGTFKNGAAVTIPYGEGQKGNAIAAALGAMIAKSALRLEILKETTPHVLKKALELVKKGNLKYSCKENEKNFRIEVFASGGSSRVHCVVSEGHTNITLLEKDGRSIIDSHPHAGSEEKEYRRIMKRMKLEELLHEVVKLDKDDRAYIQKGIEMNMAIAQKGIANNKLAYQLQEMAKAGALTDNINFRVKLSVAAAVDARMSGMPEPVMTSGGSGNQGTLTILGPYLMGREWKIDQARIQESIAISHAVNSYIKCFTGELSVLCGCGIAAGISAAAAMVYQKAGIDMQKITFAVNNVIGDLCGIICDGAKPGCAMKVTTGAETAIRSAIIALMGYGLSADEGVLGKTAEESIQNLSAISLRGMFQVDPTVIHILEDKITRRGMA
jgi:L-cysteine desulfidase